MPAINNNHNRRLRISLRQRIALAMLASALLLVPVISISLYYVSQMNALATLLAGDDTELLRLGNTILYNFSFVRNAERNYLLYNDTFYIGNARLQLNQTALLCERGRRIDSSLQSQFDTIIQAVLVYHRLLDSLVQIKKLRPVYRTEKSPTSLRAGYQTLLQTAETTADPRVKDSLFTAAKLLLQEIEGNELIGAVSQSLNQRMNETAHRIITAGEKIIARANQRIGDHKTRITRLFFLSQRNIITTIIILTALLIALIIRLPQQITLPIKRIKSALARAEQGDLDIRITPTSNDELADLIRQLNRVFARLRDFDDRKAAYISEQERRFRLLAGSISEGVILVDREPKILYANPAAAPLLEKNPNECVNRPLKEFPGLQPLLSHLEQVLSGATGHQECEVLPGFPASAVCFEVLRDRSGNATGALIIITNPAPPE